MISVHPTHAKTNVMLKTSLNNKTIFIKKKSSGTTSNSLTRSHFPRLSILEFRFPRPKDHFQRQREKEKKKRAT
jgi:hypothetical protein